MARPPFRSPVHSSVLLLALAAAACGGTGTPPSPAASPPEPLRLATTTSTQDSGLLDAILPDLERDCRVKVRVIAVGSGQALRLGKDGEADLLLTHDPAGEEAFMKSGAGAERRPFMYNDFVIAGPAADPAAVKGLTDAKEALRRIAAAKAPWLSRGDDSGTHRKEKRLMADAGVTPGAPWFRETGQGMGATLAMAAEAGAYTLADRATWSAHKANASLPILVEGDPALRNPYALLLLDPVRYPHVRSAAARRAADWLTGAPGRRAVAGYRRGGRQLFFLLQGD
jgi:tungstate transport system substrate-binding protein